jgi:membrane-bound metal-dependent hydrolase YbcI (DUF457 family)
MQYFYRLLGQTDYILQIFLIGSLIILATKVYITLNHFEISVKFSSTLRIRVFSHVRDLLAAKNKIVLFPVAIASTLEVLLSYLYTEFVRNFLPYSCYGFITRNKHTPVNKITHCLLLSHTLFHWSYNLIQSRTKQKKPEMLTRVFSWCSQTIYYL